MREFVFGGLHLCGLTARLFIIRSLRIVLTLVGQKILDAYEIYRPASTIKTKLVIVGTIFLYALMEIRDSYMKIGKYDFLVFFLTILQVCAYICLQYPHVYQEQEPEQFLMDKLNKHKAYHMLGCWALQYYILKQHLQFISFTTSNFIIVGISIKLIIDLCSYFLKLRRDSKKLSRILVDLREFFSSINHNAGYIIGYFLELTQNSLFLTVVNPAYYGFKIMLQELSEIYLLWVYTKKQQKTPKYIGPPISKTDPGVPKEKKIYGPLSGSLKLDFFIYCFLGLAIWYQDYRNVAEINDSMMTTFCQILVTSIVIFWSQSGSTGAPLKGGAKIPGKNLEKDHLEYPKNQIHLSATATTSEIPLDLKTNA